MDNASARCKESPEAYYLSFSRDVNDVQYMINHYCFQCPIRMDCLIEAIDKDYYGIWGGRTRAERKALKNVDKLFHP